MKKHHFHHLWLILAAYGVWFATFSGIEELVAGNWWKVTASLVLGCISYYIIEKKLQK